MAQTRDVAVVGGGIIGIAVAREIALRSPSTRVTVLEKETALGAHASGRNSGVLHAGFYYSPDSLKAALTRRGNAMLRAFLAEQSVAVRPTGKVVVATSHEQLGDLDELERRGRANGVELHMVDEAGLRELEPMARTVERALWSPTTAVADPLEVIEALAADARARGVDVRLGERVVSATLGSVRTDRADYSVGHVVNAAGLYADRVAVGFGMAEPYIMLPFKGLYWYSDAVESPLRRHVYPVPDPRNPFLGVHATVTAHGKLKVGPTAIPALWRENYRGLSGFHGVETLETLAGMAKLATSPHHDFAALVRAELPKYLRSALVSQAAALVPGLDTASFRLRGRPGIRAQLFDTEKRRLEMDFIVRGDEHSTHLLNSVSPAWTSALAVAEHTVDGMVERGAL